jgi:XRE family transcriptional regulator, regulator of sulfur utilization
MPRYSAKNPKLAISFGKTIRALRVNAGISQDRFAEIAQVDRAYVGYIERGTYLPSLDLIARLASALGVPAGAIVDAAIDGVENAAKD